MVWLSWFCIPLLLTVVQPLHSKTTGCPEHCTCTTEMYNCKPGPGTNFKMSAVPSSFSETVRSVDFSHNQIKNLTSIPEASGLTFLNFTSNGMESIMYDAFDNLDNLEELWLSNNKITKITDDIFEWNPLKLQELRLDHNKLTFVQHFLLYDLEDLKILDLSYNEISFIHPHAFTQLKHLNELRINNNDLYTFEAKWLKGLHANMFKAIKVEHNHWSCDCAMKAATTWIKATKWVQPLLENLTCQVHSADATQPILVLNAENENEATCQDPRITGISETTVLKAGQSIQLDCITEKTFPRASVVWVAPGTDRYSFHTADRFEGIEAYKNGSIVIHKFTKEDNGMYNCTATNGKTTTIASTTITATAGGHKKPKPIVEDVSVDDTIEVKHNVSQDCPKECQCMSRHIDCSSEGSAKLTTTPKYDQFDKDVLTITYANNLIKKIPSNAFMSYTSLEEIRLDNNMITTISKNAFKLASLSTLTMRDNQLYRVTNGLFSGLSKLTILVLDNNKLLEIGDGMLKGLVKLQWLYVRNNVISTIGPNAFRDLQDIRFIHLEGNDLKTISVETIQPLTNAPTVTIKKVFVDDNSFVCDCLLNDMRKYLIANPTSDLFGDGIMCSFPIELDGIFVVNAPKLNCSNEVSVAANPPSSGSMSALWFGGLILGVILTIAGLFVWKKWRCRIGGPPVAYQNVPGMDESSEHASILSNKSGGSEAFV